MVTTNNLSCVSVKKNLSGGKEPKRHVFINQQIELLPITSFSSIKMSRWKVASVLLLTILTNNVVSLDYTPVISTRYGQLRGIYQQIPGTNKVATYLGIPYATPPIGPNRLSPTRAPSQWKGILDASINPPACPQNPPKEYRHLLKRQSEDCLYLNLYVPDGPKGLPVMVVLHGEGFDWGAGSLYDGSHLSAHGRVVVVTLNYRVGVLGFFNPIQPGSRPIVANYGLMDQLASLHWLQENIGRFGGDPAQVTVMAHGHGAACLSLLILSPAASSSGLFRRVILMSGTALSPWALVRDPSHYAHEMATQLGCRFPSHPASMMAYEQLLHCIRNRSVDQIMKVQLESPQFLSAIGPSVDGVTVKQNWKQRLANLGADGKSQIEVLLGVAEVPQKSIFSTDQKQKGIDVTTRDKIIRTFVANNYHYHLQELVLAITAEYTDWARPSQHPLALRDMTSAALHDASIVAPAIMTASTLTSNRFTFFYVLDNRPRDQNERPLNEMDLILGAPLGAKHDLALGRNYTKQDETLSEVLIQLWSNFARTGNPNEVNFNISNEGKEIERNTYRPASWKPFEDEMRYYLELGPGRGRVRDHYRAPRVALWTWLLPALEKVGSRFGPDSSFHDVYASSDSFSGPTRPRALLPLTSTKRPKLKDSSIEQVTILKNGKVGNNNRGNNYHEAVREMEAIQGKNSGDFHEDIHYSTALTLTAAIGVSLLLLNILVLAAFHYRRSNANKSEIDDSSKQRRNTTGSTPSNCETLPSSETLRSLACPQDWPPDYTVPSCIESEQPQLSSMNP